MVNCQTWYAVMNPTTDFLGINLIGTIDGELGREVGTVQIV